MYQRLSAACTNAFVVLSLFTHGLAVPAIPRQSGNQRSAPATTYPCAGPLYDFDGSTQGWEAAEYSDGYSSLKNSNEPDGKDGLSLHVELSNSRPSAEFLVELSVNPPVCANSAGPNAMLWEPGSVLSVWLWAPEGAVGNPADANGVHLFAVDENGRQLYGPWQSIRENTWFEVILRLEDQETPACGSKGFRFDPDHIAKIGINIGVSKSQTEPFNMTFRMSGLSIKKDELSEIRSDHAYSFDDGSEESGFPRWRINPGWGARAFTEVRAENGALTADADFKTREDATSKGAVSLVYAPPLDLSLLKEEDRFFSVDIRFEASMESRRHCPFGITLWVFDADKKSWYTSPYENVGSTHTTRVTFPLSDFQSQEYPDKPLDLGQVGELTLQVWGNTNYKGKIWFDTISLGGEIPRLEDKDLTPITREGPHFRRGDQRFRFIGANAEYLPFVSNPVMIDVLQRAKDMGITVMRTWGFSDGCEDKSQGDCADRSRYFQPLPGVYNEAAFEHFDRILWEANQRDIRLIIPLANNWPEYGGIPQYVCWQEEYNPEDEPDCSTKPMEPRLHDKFYTDETIKDLYKDYVHHFVNHVNTLTGVPYKNDPTIMAWELINEPRAPFDPSGKTLHDWIAEMSSFLADEEVTQLIGTAEEGWYILPQEDAGQFAGWQDFPKNYWHYGVNWQPAECTGADSWGSNGVDFLSNHSTEPRTVTWQLRAGQNTSLKPTSQEREGIPAVSYTTIHLYPAPGETSLAFAPYCYYNGLNSLCSSFYGRHQAQAWIAQHVDTSHNVLKKPFIMEEFNFPVLQGEPSGLPSNEAEFRVTREQRARLFTQYFDMAYDLDVDGVMFWNLGYDGFADQPWSEAPALQNWIALSESDGLPKDDIDEDPSPNRPGVRLAYEPRRGFQKAVMVLSDPRVDWLKADGNRVFLDLFNDGDAQSVMFRVLFSNGEQRLSTKYALTFGNNHLNLSELFRLMPAPSQDGCEQPEADPPQVTGIIVTLRGYTTKGNAYFEFRSLFNNKYVVYPEDPVEEVIELAADRWKNDVDPAPSVARINESVTCNQVLHPQLIDRMKDKILPIEFTLSGALEHPDGFFYRARILYPDHHEVTRIGSVGVGFSFGLWVDVKPASTRQEYQVMVAPEGESFASPNASSCTFVIGNDVPTLSVEEILVDGRPIEPVFREPDHVLEVSTTAPLYEDSKIEVRLSGRDDISEELRLCDIRLHDNTKGSFDRFVCEPTLAASTSLGAVGAPSSLLWQLSPGNHEIQIWLEDEDSASSIVYRVKINVLSSPHERWIGILGILLIVVSFAGLGFVYTRWRKRNLQNLPA